MTTAAGWQGGEMIEREQKWDEQKRDAALAAVSPPLPAGAAIDAGREAARKLIQPDSCADTFADAVLRAAHEAITLLKQSHGERAGEAVPIGWLVPVRLNGRRFSEFTQLLPFTPDADSGMEVTGKPMPVYDRPAPAQGYAEGLEAAASLCEKHGSRYFALRIRALSPAPSAAQAAERAGEAVAWMTGDGFPVGLDEAGDRKGGYPLYGQPNEQIEMYKHLVAQLKRELAIAKAPDASPAPSPEEGYVRVPREPSQAVIEAMAECYDPTWAYPDRSVANKWAAESYSEVIAAAEGKV